MSEKTAKKSRRDYGTGSVYQRSDGRWAGVVQAGWTERGTRRRVTVTAKTEAQAKVKLRQKIADIEKAGVSQVSSRTTVKQWSEDWLAIQETTLRPKSFTATRSAVKVWIIPTIGHKRLDQLAPADVRDVIAAMRKKGRAESSRRRVHSDLIGMLKAAREEGHPIPERVIAVKAPPKGSNDRTNLEPEQAVQMLTEAAKRPDASRYVAAFLNGMRQSECLGLTWDAIDFERNLITIEWQLQPLSYNVKYDRSSGFRVPDGYEAVPVRDRYHLVRPKTDAGVRVIPMLPWLKSSLETWREVAPKNPSGLVWPITTGDCQKVDDDAFAALQDTVGVRHPTGRRYTIHEARHTTATLLLEAGVDPVIIAAIMGQSKMIKDYMHVKAGPIAEALEKVGAVLMLKEAA